MTTTNLWKRLKQIISDDPLLVGVVESVSSYGAVVVTPDGARVSVRGTASVGDHVFFRSGLIEGPAPELTAVLIEI